MPLGTLDQFSKDYFLIDLRRRVLVGILSNFLANKRIDKEYIRVTSALYTNLYKVTSKNQVRIQAILLSKVLKIQV